jgi:catechol 2,3-dioxygenase-like lactoylglutathione lyase family enzyme
MKIRHVGFSVHDEKTALRFYRDLLGFKVVKKAKEDVNYIKQLLGVVNVEYIKLKKDDDMIEMYLMPRDKQKGRWNHLAFSVDDVDALYIKLIGEQVKFMSPPIIDPAGECKLCFCYDYDGNMIELVEDLKVHKGTTRLSKKRIPMKTTKKKIPMKKSPKSISEADLEKDYKDADE